MPNEVHDYYQKSPRRFLSFGQGRKQLAIHRAVWGEGVRSRDEAIDYINHLIAEGIRTHGVPHSRMIDLGSGFGGTLFYLSRQFPLRGLGISLSPFQVNEANRHAARLGVSDRVRFEVADYRTIPASNLTAGVAFAVESFVHGPEDPRGFFEEASRVLAPGGLLMICDDFLFERRELSAAEQRHLQEVKSGWKWNCLMTAREAGAAAEACGFETLSAADLTPLLELGRPRDRMIRAMMKVARPLNLRSPMIDMLRGGDSLQWCLMNGVLCCKFLVFRKSRNDFLRTVGAAHEPR